MSADIIRIGIIVAVLSLMAACGGTNVATREARPPQAIFVPQ